MTHILVQRIYDIALVAALCAAFIPRGYSLVLLAKPNRIGEHGNDDGNRCRNYLLDHNRLGSCRCDKDVWIERRQLGRKSWHAVVVASRKSVHHVEIPTFGVPELSHTFQKWREDFARPHVSVGSALRTRP
jgi:hypothetical protein